ncbi:MAG: hypothetical protein ACHQHN_00685 [Sphingobacteriales bacterium]
MKLAFLFGSNIFIIPDNTISYIDNDQTNIFLKIKSIFHKNREESVLTIDTDLKDIEGRGLKLHDNEIISSFGYKVSKTHDRILAKGMDDSTVFDIQQLDDESARNLEENIIAELETHEPDAIFRIKGDFMMGKMHFAIDNDKLSIGRESYTCSAVSADQGLKFAPTGFFFA